MSDLRIIREEVCQGCINKKEGYVQACSLYQECAIDYNTRKCKYKKTCRKKEGE